MENQTSCMKHLKNVFSQTGEFPIECDLILPDYYPEISRILDCRIVLSDEAVTVTADKISVAGKADVRLLYASSAAEMRTYESIFKYTRIFSGGDFEQGDICFAEQAVTAVNYQAVSPRRIEVRASSGVKVKVLRISDMPLFADQDIPNIQKRIAERTGIRINTIQCMRFDLEDKISLPVPREKITGMLRSSIRIVWSEIKTTEHKVMLSGTAEIAFVYIGDDNSVSREYNVSLPVKTIKEVFGVCESDSCCINMMNAVLSVDLKNPAVGENEAAISVQVCALIVAGCEQKYSAVTDAYSLCGELKALKQSVFTPERIVQKNETIDVSGEIPVYDMRITKVCDNDAADIACAAVPDGDGIRLNGSFNMKVLTIADDNSYVGFSRNCSFEYMLLTEPTSYHYLYIQPQSFRTELMEGKLRYYGKLQISAIVLPGTEEEIITSAETDDEDKHRENDRIVLYYGEKGESLWEIAKENKTALDSLYAFNEVKTEILQEDQLLVFRA